MVASSQTKVSCIAASIFSLSSSSSLSSDILVHRVRAYETIILNILGIDLGLVGLAFNAALSPS